MLLDTNALLWLYHDSPRLGPRARDGIANASRVYYSAASVMEIMIKHMLGRIELPGGDGFPEIFARSGLAELTFSAAHAHAMRRDPGLSRHDPFDRLLLAQARAEGLDLLTSDATLLGLGDARIRDARS